MRFYFPSACFATLIVSMFACKRDSPVPQAAASTEAARPLSAPAARADTSREWAEWGIDGHPQFAGRALIRGSRLVVALDTMGDGPAHRWVPTDSVITDMSDKETFSTDCRRDSTSSQEIVGLVLYTDTASTQIPRLAWFLDLGTNKVLSIRPDSLRCFLQGAVD